MLGGIPKRASSLSVVFLILAMTLICCLASAGQTAEGASVESFTPQGLIEIPTGIRIVFTSEMVKSADVGRDLGLDELPFTVTPLLRGNGRWTNTSTFIYMPDMREFPPAMEFTVRLNNSLSDVKGKRVSGTREFKMNTPPLTLRSIAQVNYDIERSEIHYRLSFNLPVNQSRLAEYLSITDSKGNVLSYSLVGSGSDSIQQIRIAQFEDDSDITMSIEKGLPPETGVLGLQERTSVKIARDLTLKIGGTSINNSVDGAHLFISTSAPVDEDKFRPFIEVTPERDFSLEADWGGIWIRGDFKARDMITVKFRKGLPALRGPGLAEDCARLFVIPDIYPSVAFSSGGRFISPVNESAILPVSMVNAEDLNVRISRVYNNNVPFVLRYDWGRYVYDLAETVFEKTYQITAEPNESVEYSIDLKKILNGGKGLYEVYVSKKDHWASDGRLINITDIAGSMKLWETGALAWANSITDGKPIEGVKVSIYSQSNQLLAEGLTDGLGLCAMERSQPWEPNLMPRVAVLERGDDISVLPLDSGIWSEGAPEYAGLPYSNGEYIGICFTPRGVFRPGESVPINVLMRERDLSLKEPFPVVLKVTTSTWMEWKSETINLSPMGFGGTVVQTSDSAPTGSWRAEIFIPGESKPLASTNFMIEDFVPPRIAVDVSLDKNELFADDEAELSISAQYLFGAPADGLNFEVATLVTPREYTHPNWSGFRFINCTAEFSRRETEEGGGALSRDGKANFTISRRSYDAPSVLDFTIRTGVMEDSGRWVYKSLTAPFYPSRTLLGIMPPDGAISTKKSIPFKFAAIDTSGEPVALDDARLSVFKTYQRYVALFEEGRRRYVTRTEQVPLENFESVPISFNDGSASEDIIFETSGTYLIVIEDEETESKAAIRVYVYNSNWGYYTDEASLPENLNITLDKPLYKAGDRANIRVSGASGGSTLLTVETDRVLRSYVSSAGEGSSEFSIDITEDMAPNAWITAHLVKPAVAEDVWSAHRAFGAVPINVDCSSRALSIDIVQPEELSPNARNDFRVQLRDSNGDGVRGEVVLMLVDEGVLSLTGFETPDFFEYYMRRRGLQVAAHDIYEDLMPLYLKNSPALSPGGGMTEDSYGKMTKASLSPIKAKRFRVLTVSDRVVTDENGSASASLEIPEFSGNARLMAVGASSGAFGSSERNFVTARDVVAEIALPRAVAPLDTFESQIQLFNTTGLSLDVEIDLGIDGPILITREGDRKVPSDDAREYHDKITLPPSESPRSVSFLMEAGEEAGLSKFTLSLRYPGGEMSETTELAVRPPYPRVSETGSAIVPAGASVGISFKNKLYPGTEGTVVNMSGLPSVELSDMAMFLAYYPYSCLEQTISRGRALLSQPDLVARIYPDLGARSQSSHELSEIIMQIRSMQSYNGAFRMWSNSSYDDWLSVYAAHFLISCRMKGVEISEAALRSVLLYLDNLISQIPNTDEEIMYSSALALRSYISYVKSLNGDPPLGWMSYLRDNLNHMPEYGRILLAAAYARSGQRQEARRMLGEKIAPPSKNSDGQDMKMWNFDSELRTRAMYLMAWNEIDPTGPDAAVSAAELLGLFRESAYYNTQEAGWILSSLADYFSFNYEEADPVLELTGGRSDRIAVSSGDETVSARVDEEKIAGLSVVNSGDGRGYVSWTRDGVPTETPEPEDLGISAVVEYYDSNGMRIENNSEIEMGQRLTGVVKIYPLARNVENIVVVLPLAGGLEIENPRFKDADSGDNNTYNSRSELRDDRLIIFADYFNGPFTWKFVMRAVTRGKFTLPPIAAEGMYSKGVRSIGRTSAIIIK
ncbi:MAG: hypothetical protein LBI74_05600 [Synergistaceae bacterium]|nr:hypothetical protein [Synergistaceae bacterium]